jgi:hypothetical protein
VREEFVFWVAYKAMPFGGASLTCVTMSSASAKQEAAAVAIMILFVRFCQPLCCQKLEMK